MADLIIRPAEQGDLPGLLALYRHLHPDDLELDPSEAEPAWSALLSSNLTTVIVADAAGSLVSSCTLAVVPNLSHGARPYGVIDNVVTHSEHRRRGLGRAVLQAALAIAWNANCYKVTLGTGSRRESTLRFYEGAGFLQDGKTHFEIRRL
jgi:GNAT superfamily N-acetyltransferase